MLNHLRIKSVRACRLSAAIAAALCILTGGCVFVRKDSRHSGATFNSVPSSDYPDFTDSDSKRPLLEAAQNSLKYLESLKVQGKSIQLNYFIAGRKVTAQDLEKSIKAFIKICENAQSQDDFKEQIADKFAVYRSAGGDDGRVIFSSYYEPVLTASKEKTGEYKYPVYRRPQDLVDIELDAFGEKWKGEKLAGRIESGKFVPYHSRSKIDIEKILTGRGLEIAWFKSRLEIMDLHVEGSAKVKFTDGTQARVHYAGTNGLTFRGPISNMVSKGIIKKGSDAHEEAKKYLEEHPEQEQELLSVNSRYTFFEILPVRKNSDGPLGTISQPLIAERSIAVDPKHIPLGTLAYIEFSKPDIDKKGRNRGKVKDSRFVFCQDTGGAIKSPGRVDYFAGTGQKAKQMANAMWNEGALYLLLLKN